MMLSAGGHIKHTYGYPNNRCETSIQADKAITALISKAILETESLRRKMLDHMLAVFIEARDHHIIMSEEIVIDPKRLSGIHRLNLKGTYGCYYVSDEAGDFRAEYTRNCAEIALLEEKNRKLARMF